METDTSQDTDEASFPPPKRKRTSNSNTNADNGSHRATKQQKASHDDPDTTSSPSVDDSPIFRHEQYTVAWICALHIEMAAAEAMLDKTHAKLPTDAQDTNTYTLGSIGLHNVVIACLPAEQYGTNNAANVASNLKRSFPSIRAGLMVGIGGGAPSKGDIRLGDVVVGIRVMQCDLGKAVGDGQLRRTATPRIPPQSLGTAVTALRAKHERESNSISTIVEEKFEHNASYRRPSSPDELFPATYEHVSVVSDCTECNSSTLVPRSVRDHPTIHYGAIASGNQVMRSASQRDDIAQELDIICFEMEAAGIMDVIPCLPIRGICDYADSHKNKTWQRYAAATAAACARELLALLSTSEPLSSAHSYISGQSQTANEREKLLEALKFDQLDSRHLTIKVAHKNTCRWLLEDPHYQAWLDPKNLTTHNGFLWIRAKPGAGKSTLMKFAHSNMRNRRQKETVTAAFFFNARGEALERSIEGMYRSLLIQVLEGFPELRLVLNDQSYIVEPEDGCPSLQVLKDLLQSAVLSLGQRRLTCFIDALDECDEQQVMDMVETFEDLAERSATTGISFRVCFSSRHYPYITIRKGIEFTLENRPGHDGDLASYVASRLRVTEGNLSSELKQMLLEKASGVFLWVALVVDMLNREHARGSMALKTTLAKIPSDLHDLFKDILRRDDANKEQLLISVLWILCARRPLHPSEFSHAVWAGMSLQGLADPDPPVVNVTETDISTDRCVVGSSKGLAEITKGDRPTVQFIHESVRDFLLSAGGLQEMWPDVGFDWEMPSQDKLKRCCEAYLGHPSVAGPVGRALTGTPVGHESFDLERFTFLKYSVQNVLYHADVAAQIICQDEFLSTFCTRSWIQMSNHFERHPVRRYTEDANILYVLAERGFSNLTRTRLRKYPKTDIIGERYWYPLFTALAHGKGDAAAALLGLPSRIYKGQDIARGIKSRRDMERSESRTPLTWAAQEGRVDICELLLQNGYDIDETDKSGNAPLTIASQNNQYALAEALIDWGANVNSCGKWSPIEAAAMGGHEELVKLLLEKGASIYKINEHGDPLAIQWAISAGDPMIVKLLIDAGESKRRVNDLQTALSWAVRFGKLEVVRLLLEEGSGVQTETDGPKDQPLTYAIRSGHREILELLIENGADTTHCSGDLLLFAIEQREERLARLAIEKGADVNSKNTLLGGASLRPLSEAVQMVDEPMARLLLEHGADVNLCETGEMTPLHMAASRGHEAIVNLFVEYGANVNTGTTRKNSPLRAALKRNHRAIARLLVQKGAKVPPKYRNLAWLHRR